MNAEVKPKGCSRRESGGKQRIGRRKPVGSREVVWAQLLRDCPQNILARSISMQGTCQWKMMAAEFRNEAMKTLEPSIGEVDSLGEVVWLKPCQDSAKIEVRVRCGEIKGG